MSGSAVAAGIPKELKQSVVSHYEAQLERFGPTARGMDWKDDASQRLRFAVLCEICDLEGRSVHDLGAGAGHLWDFLRERGVRADYSGSDLSEHMVAAARRLHPEVSFEQRDLLAEPPGGPFDVLLCSGLFHVKLDRPEDEWRGFVREIVRRMYALCRVGIAFNLMSDRVDFRSPTLFYEDPATMLTFCQRELSRHVTLRHDYPLYEFTVYVYRDGHAP